MSVRVPRSIRAAAAAATMVLAFSACDHKSTGPVASALVPTAPTTTATPTVPTVTLSGNVVERSSARPIPGVSIIIWPQTYPTNRQWKWVPRSVTTDGSGHYSMSGIENDFGSFWVHAYAANQPQFLQQCATTVNLRSDQSQDLALTSRDNLAIDGSALPAIPGARTVSGIVFETSDAGAHPIAGAHVGWEGDMDIEVASTITDSNGRYLLCGLPTSRLTSLTVWKDGYSNSDPYRTVEAGGDAVLDLEIRK